jgi:hypothetical protein
MLLSVVTLLACGGGTPAPPDTTWVRSVKPWYCGSEQVEAKETASGARAARSRDMAMKVAPGQDSLTAVYALENAGERYIGHLTRFEPTGPRAATLAWENDRKQKGKAQLTFSEDFQSLTVAWQVGDEPSSGASTLTASDPAACPGAARIR